MSNGAQCCALEICCPPASARQQETLARMIATFTGADAGYCLKFLDWMKHEELVFAPASFSAVVQEIVAATRKHQAIGGGADLQEVKE